MGQYIFMCQQAGLSREQYYGHSYLEQFGKPPPRDYQASYKPGHWVILKDRMTHFICMSHVQDWKWTWCMTKIWSSAKTWDWCFTWYTDCILFIVMGMEQAISILSFGILMLTYLILSNWKTLDFSCEVQLEPDYYLCFSIDPQWSSVLVYGNPYFSEYFSSKNHFLWVS